MVDYFPPANNTDIVGLVQYANSAADGFLGALMILAIFIILFMQLQGRFAPKQAFAASGFISAILASFFWVMGILDTGYLAAAIIVSIGGFIWLYQTDAPVS